MRLNSHSIHGLWLCVAFCVCASRGAIAQEPSDDERHQADCIDAVNDPAASGDLSLKKNPFRLQASGAAGVTPVGNPRSAVSDGFLYGGDLDLELPVFPALLASGGTVLGPAFGVAGSTRWSGDGRNDAQGELRIGMVRRRWIPNWSATTGACGMQRSDIGVDVLRWRVGRFKSPGQPGRLESSIALPAIVWRVDYPSWGLGFGVAPLEFRLTPSFEFGGRADLTYRFHRVFGRLEIGGHYLPDQFLFAAVNLGVVFEFGGA